MMMDMSVKYMALLIGISFLSACKHDDMSPSYVKVYKHDGSVQCASAGVAPNVMAAELINAGIDVICSQKGHDGMNRIAVCGAATGNINVYTINMTSLPVAESINFKSVRNISEYQDQKCG